MNEPIILGIESSCDDTSAAIINGNKILSNIAAESNGTPRIWWRSSRIGF